MSELPHPIIGLLLAAGHSRRFGNTDKLMQRLPCSTPMAVVSARHLLAALPHCIAVVRQQNTQLAAELAALGMGLVQADATQTVMADSMRLGVTAIQQQWPQCGGVLVALADMPNIQAESYQQVLAGLATGAGIVQPSYQGQPGHPVAFASHMLPALLQVEGDQGARAMLKTHANQCLKLEVSDAGVVLDIDTPQQLHAYESGHRLI